MPQPAVETVRATRKGEARLTVNDMAFERNAAIDKWINWYTATQGGRRTMTIGIDRSSQYLEMARAEFRAAGLPEDLVWLAHVESVWHAEARSPAAAAGIWQFIPRTATDYGLTVEAGNDERFDARKQTKVAAAYLRDLYTIFGDWALAMAAYNCGEPRVMEAVVKNGRADFWELHEKSLLPKETLNYVPKILAAITVAREAKSYNVMPGPSSDDNVAGL
jgi:membrane-bound lytic murein transglycosylase D